MERTEVVDMDTNDPGILADRRLIPLEIKVTFAFTNAPQAQYLMHYVTIDAWSDGSDTLAGVKQKFADKEGVPVEHIKFMWMDEPIGRCARRPTLSSRPLAISRPFPLPANFFLDVRFREMSSPETLTPTTAQDLPGPPPSEEGPWGGGHDDEAAQHPRDPTPGFTSFPTGAFYAPQSPRMKNARRSKKFTEPSPRRSRGTKKDRNSTGTSRRSARRRSGTP